MPLQTTTAAAAASTTYNTYVDETCHSDLLENQIASLEAKIVFVGGKVDHYARLVNLKTIREFSRREDPPSTAVFKATRCLTLILKAFVSMDSSFKQIKDEEVFLKWERIQ